MSYQAKKTITNLVAGVIILVSYCVSVFNEYSAGNTLVNDTSFWAKKMLIYIIIGIGITIVLNIIFHIYLSVNLAIKEENRNDDKAISRKLELEMVEDEMDKLIELKSHRVGYIIVGIGFMTALVYLAFGSSIAIGLNLIFVSFYMGSFAEGLTILYFYFRGILNV